MLLAVPILHIEDHNQFSKFSFRAVKVRHINADNSNTGLAVAPVAITNGLKNSFHLKYLLVKTTFSQVLANLFSRGLTEAANNFQGLDQLLGGDILGVDSVNTSPNALNDSANV